MQHTGSKLRVHKVDRLRSRIWFIQAMKLSGRTTPHSFWLHVDKKRSSRSRWYNYLTGKSVPLNEVVQRVEQELPGTASIFNALFWSVLKGLPVSHEEVSKELGVLTKAFTGQHELMQISFWMSEIQENPDQFEVPAIRAIFESRSGEEFLQLTILILALADSIGNKELWNYMCRNYRRFLPLYIPTIPWSLKDEIFDELDVYIQERIYEGVRRKPLNDSWRNSKPEVQAFVKEEYMHVLNCALSDRSINLDLLPEGFAQLLAEKLAAEFCKTEDKMLHSWHLCDPISMDIAEIVADIQLYEDGRVTVKRIIKYLDSQGYFDSAYSGNESYEKFTQIQKFHIDFFP